MTNFNETLDKLAERLGDRFYLDVAKWHLYLKDTQFNLPLAERLYVLLDENRLTLASVQEVLESMAIPVGGGRQQIPLLYLFPVNTEKTLLDVLKDFQQDYF